MTARDAQRAKVYAAEQLVRRIFDRAAQTGCHTLDLHGSRFTLPIERRFASVESIQAYAETVLALGWVRAEWARAAVQVQVRSRNGQTRAHYERANATIAIPPYKGNRAWAMRELVVLHELAHHLEPEPAAAAHGPAFVHRYALLATEVIGPEVGLLLRSTMHSEGATSAAVVTHGPSL